MSVRAGDITEQIRKQIESFEAPVEAVDVGTVEEIGDGIARVSGLACCFNCRRGSAIMVCSCG